MRSHLISDPLSNNADSCEMDMYGMPFSRETKNLLKDVWRTTVLNLPRVHRALGTCEARIGERQPGSPYLPTAQTTNQGTNYKPSPPKIMNPKVLDCTPGSLSLVKAAYVSKGSQFAAFGSAPPTDRPNRGPGHKGHPHCEAVVREQRFALHAAGPRKEKTPRLKLEGGKS